jgi:uncharacterized membrane protein
MAYTYNNYLLLLISIVIIILASLILRRLLGLSSRTIRVTARNTRSPSFSLRPEDPLSFLNYASPRPSIRRRITLSSTIKRGLLTMYVYIFYSARAVKYRIDYSVSEKYSEYVRLLRPYSLTVSDTE